MFSLFILISAAVTAMGRLGLGDEGALQTRYSTPVIMAWASIAVVFLYGFCLRAMAQQTILLFLFLISLFFLGYQIKRVERLDHVFFPHKVAGLAAELGVLDSDYLKKIFYSPKIALEYADRSRLRGISFFGEYPYRGLREQIGSVYVDAGSHECLGYIDEIISISDAGGWVRISGWMFDKNGGRSAGLLKVVDRQGLVVGVAISGNPRPDVEKVHGRDSRLSGFVGYIKAGVVGDGISIFGDKPACSLSTAAVTAGVVVGGRYPDDSSIDVAKVAFTDNAGFAGADYYRTKFEGLSVLGSYVNADGDVGRVRAHLRKGDSILYRTGPTGGRQIARVVASGRSFVLPVSIEWKALRFIDSDFSDKYEVEFIDEGDGWGEWLALAAK